MDLEPPSARIAFVAATEGAHKRLLPGMRVLVGLKVTLSDEVVVTDRAGEGSLAGVGAHVSFEVASLSELLEAALVRTEQDFCFVFGP